MALTTIRVPVFISTAAARMFSMSTNTFSQIQETDVINQISLRYTSSKILLSRNLRLIENFRYFTQACVNRDRVNLALCYMPHISFIAISTNVWDSSFHFMTHCRGIKQRLLTYCLAINFQMYQKIGLKWGPEDFEKRGKIELGMFSVIKIGQLRRCPVVIKINYRFMWIYWNWVKE